MNVVQLRYGADNLSYLLHQGREAIAIDGGASTEILSFLATHDLTLVAITNTHGHADHTPGNARLARVTRASVLSPEELVRAGSVAIGGQTVRILPTPGHTKDSVCFDGPGFVITGDTLFNGTIGNCFSGDHQGFYRSLLSLLALPEETRVYAGHDYVRDSMAFAKHLEPDHPAWDEYLESGYDPAHVFSTLEQEKQINPYLRWNAAAIVAILRANGLPTATDFERFESLLKLA